MKTISKLYHKYRDAKTALARTNEQIIETKKHAKDCMIARDELQEICRQIQQTAHKSISKIVSLCLSMAFPETYKFKLHFAKKRGKTEADLQFWKNGVRFYPTEESGGGCIDVAAYGLRLACLLLKPQVRKFLALDEPFKMVSKEDTQRVRDMVETMARDMKVQHLIITHNEELVMGKIIRIARS